MAWYNPAWLYALPVTITNGSATSALSYCQVAVMLTGAAYTSFHAHAKADGSDIVVTDSDGVTTLPFALETIDTANSVVYLVVKVSLAANASKTIYVYYGNPAASSASSYPQAIGPVNALSGPIHVANQSDVTRFHQAQGVIRLQHQDQANGGGAGLNGTLFSGVYLGLSGNGGTGCAGYLARSSDSGITWTLTQVMPVVGSGTSCNWTIEAPDGTIYMEAHSSTTRTIAKSTDGGTTWTNLANSGTPDTIVNPITGTCGRWNLPWYDTSGNLYTAAYGTATGDTTTTCWLFKCASGSDPTHGPNWSLVGSVHDATHSWSEPTILPTSADGITNLTMVVRDDSSGNTTGDLYLCKSTNGGVTWGAPTAMGIPGGGSPTTNNQAVSPYLFRLASGSIALFYGMRNNIFGSGVLISTDGGTTWLDRSPAFYSAATPTGNFSTSYGYPYPVQLANGKVVLITHEEESTNHNYQNIVGYIFDEDWVVNSPNLLETCQATTNFTSVGANTSVSSTHTFGGQANAVLMQNTSAQILLARRAWATNVSSGSAANAAVATPSVAITCWEYPTQIAAASYIGHISVNVGATVNRVGLYDTGSGTAPGTTGEVQYWNGSAYVDSTHAVNLNQWNRVTQNYTAPASSVTGTSRVNNNATASLGQYATGSAPGAMQFTAATNASINTSVYVGLIYTSQYMAAAPTLSVGAELSRGGLYPYYLDSTLSGGFADLGI